MENIIFDFAIAAAFLFVGQLIRAKLPFAQSFFIPASLIAGILGLICGRYGFGFLTFSDMSGDYSSLLIVIIFASVGFSITAKNKGSAVGETKRIFGFLSYRIVAETTQLILPVLLSITILSLITPNLNNAFGMLVISGFTGGHGTAAAVGATLAELGWADALDLGMTSATIGILSGVFGGVLIIKIGVKKGWSMNLKNYREISGELRTGMIPPEKQKSIGKDCVSFVSIEPIAWHLGMLLIPTALGCLLYKWILARFGITIPNYTCAFIIAGIMWVVMQKTNFDRYVSVDLINRIAGTCTDFLVFFGVAKISIPIVIQYAVPFTLLMIFGLAWTVFSVLWVGPRMNKEYWFERSMFCYGFLTGVFAIGFVLLRIVDPENRSKTLNDTAFTQFIITPVEALYWALAPVLLIAADFKSFFLIFTAITVAAIIFSIVTKQWYAKMPLAGRPGFEESVASEVCNE